MDVSASPSELLAGICFEVFDALSVISVQINQDFISCKNCYEFSKSRQRQADQRSDSRAGKKAQMII